MELRTKLVSLEDQLRTINERLKSNNLPDDSYRALLKTKNELVADIQSVKIRIEQAEASFNNSLNKGMEL